MRFAAGYKCKPRAARGEKVLCAEKTIGERVLSELICFFSCAKKTPFACLVLDLSKIVVDDLAVNYRREAEGD